jgi:hypothetical protein
LIGISAIQHENVGLKKMLKLSLAAIVVALLLLAGPSTAQQKQAKPAEALKTMLKAEVRLVMRPLCLSRGQVA